MTWLQLFQKNCYTKKSAVVLPTILVKDKLYKEKICKFEAQSRSVIFQRNCHTKKSAVVQCEYANLTVNQKYAFTDFLKILKCLSTKVCLSREL